MHFTFHTTFFAYFSHDGHSRTIVVIQVKHQQSRNVLPCTCNYLLRATLAASILHFTFTNCNTDNNIWNLNNLGFLY
jgi:hypothetical protein